MSKYRYKVSSTNNNSHSYGNCEVCGKHCTEVFVQTEEREYMLPDIIAIERNTKYGWTQHECKTIFGHEKCLLSKQR